MTSFGFPLVASDEGLEGLLEAVEYLLMHPPMVLASELLESSRTLDSCHIAKIFSQSLAANFLRF